MFKAIALGLTLSFASSIKLNHQADGKYYVIQLLMLKISTLFKEPQIVSLELKFQI